jgi:hypothetical protein
LGTLCGEVQVDIGFDDGADQATPSGSLKRMCYSKVLWPISCIDLIKLPYQGAL